MEFESPDAEKDFPGLYSDGARKANESDFSDDNHDKSLEKSFKSDVIGKKKDKKDRGYAALEGESSQDEDSKSPSKTKKTKTFKFPVKKLEKREKLRDKEVIDKNVEKEKKKDKDKKEKSKIKEKKKHKADTEELEGFGVFGVPLEKAVERLGCLDGVLIPLPVRHCIDCIHAAGLQCENLYKPSTIKAKVQTLRKSYNNRDVVSDLDVSVASSLLITFLKELPDHILGELVARFEEAAATQDVAERENQLASLLSQLQPCNRTLVAWLMVHFDEITRHEEVNKMNAQSIAIIFSPILQMSHRLLTAFLCHCKSLFSEVTIHKYIPPLPPGSNFPDDAAALESELRKQEALLNQLHLGISEGFVDERREEQLWEVQRIVTDLKRRLKRLQKMTDSSKMQKSLDEELMTAQMSENPAQTGKLAVDPDPEDTKQPVQVAQSKEIPTSGIALEDKNDPSDAFKPAIPPLLETALQTDPTQAVDKGKISKPLADIRLELENLELHKLHASLQERLNHERRQAAKLRAQIETYRGFVDSDSEEWSATSTPTYLSPESESQFRKLLEEHHLLLTRRDELSRKIMEEREACVKLSVDIACIELMNNVT